jgi:pimeloyl-ACP methyl ester carboxylesterase
VIVYPFAVGDRLTRVFEGGDGPLVVLVHGMTGNADRWQNSIDPLAAAGYRVLAFDLPGHGFATKGADFAYTVNGFTDHLEQFLDAVGADDDVTLVGASLGGHIAATAVCRAPDRFNALGLVGSAGLVPLGADDRATRAVNLFDMSREGIRRRKMFTLAAPEALATITDENVEEDFRINSSPGAAEGWAAIAEAFVSMDEEGIDLAALDATGVPVLLVWGTEERNIPLSVGQSTHAALSRSTLAYIEGAAHLPFLEKPAAFTDAVTSFLSAEVTR